jgi:hypothetical protein
VACKAVKCRFRELRHSPSVSPSVSQSSSHGSELQGGKEVGWLVTWVTIQINTSKQTREDDAKMEKMKMRLLDVGYALHPYQSIQEGLGKEGKE